MVEQTKLWIELLAEIARKTKGKGTEFPNVPVALNNALARPSIYVVFGIHGNILFPDAGYCEFDDPDNAWMHLQYWATMAAKCKGV
nr:hypothetical protein [Candidatus Sigynarchaeota archaeon]